MYVKYFWFLLLFSAHASADTPNIQHWKNARGAGVYFVETHELPIIDLQIILDAGSARDKPGKRGLAMLTSGLIGEGAGGRDANSISFEFERLGAVFSTDSGYDSASISLRSLSEGKKLKPALDNLELVLGSPDFPDKAVERLRNQMLTGIAYKQQSPSDLANDSFFAAIYGDHPYAYPKEGNEQDVKKLTRDDVRAFFEQYYTASNATIAIVGDLSRTQARKMADRLSRVLKNGRAPDPLPAVKTLTQDNVISLNHPSAQTHIIMGQPGIKRNDPDYFTLYVGNHILGGSGLVSMLNEEIRESRGLAYSVYSYFLPMRENGPFMAGLQTRADQGDDALKLMRETITGFVQNGPTQEQLQAAQKNITGGFPLRIDSNGDILGYVGVIGFYKLPLDYLDTFNSKVEAVTSEMIRDAFARRITPGKMVTVVVGPEQTQPGS